MRGLIITLVLFTILIFAITLNAVFIKNSILYMKQMAEQLSPIPCDENETIITEFKNKWDKINMFISLAVNYDNIEELTDRIDAVKAANLTNNQEQLQIQIELLINSIEEIGRLEEFSIKNIL